MGFHLGNKFPRIPARFLKTFERESDDEVSVTCLTAYEPQPGALATMLSAIGLDYTAGKGFDGVSVSWCCEDYENKVFAVSDSSWFEGDTLIEFSCASDIYDHDPGLKKLFENENSAEDDEEFRSDFWVDEETFKKELQEYLKAPKMSLESMREILLEKLSGDSIRLFIDVKKDLTASDRKVVGKFLSWIAKGVKCSQIHGDWINFQYDISKAEFYSRINEHIFEPIGSVARGCEILNAVYPDTFTSVLYDATLCIFKVDIYDWTRDLKEFCPKICH